jgi:putative membrane protein
MSISESLARERTHLANERTFLAYTRTSIVVFSSGFAIVKLSVLQELKEFGVACLIAAPVFALIGVYRFFRVRKKINRFSKKETTKNSDHD